MHPFPESSEESTKIKEVTRIPGDGAQGRRDGESQDSQWQDSLRVTAAPINRSSPLQSTVSQEVQFQLLGKNEISRRPDSFKGRLGKLTSQGLWIKLMWSTHIHAHSHTHISQTVINSNNTKQREEINSYTPTQGRTGWPRQRYKGRPWWRQAWMETFSSKWLVIVFFPTDLF